ncbi:hypothetical protein [Echinicola arenosa]|nr:hypothetical protein [Echinicola arenosa]
MKTKQHSLNFSDPVVQLLGQASLQPQAFDFWLLALNLQPFS